MVELIKDPERRKAMGRRARYRVENDFEEETYVKRHLQLIQSMQPKAAEGHFAQSNPKAKIELQISHNAQVNRPQPFTHQESRGDKNSGR
jgi:hypothetical protein